MMLTASRAVYAIGCEGTNAIGKDDPSAFARAMADLSAGTPPANLLCFGGARHAVARTVRIRNTTGKTLLIDGLSLVSRLGGDDPLLRIDGPDPIVFMHLVVQGPDPASGGLAPTGVLINSENVVITSGSRVTDFFYGVVMNGSHAMLDGVKIVRHTAQSGSGGVYVQGGVGSMIVGTTIIGFDTGAALIGTQHQLSESRITGAIVPDGATSEVSEVGIYLRGDDLQATGNTIAHVKTGVLLDPINGARGLTVSGGSIDSAAVGIQATANLQLAADVPLQVRPTAFHQVARWYQATPLLEETWPNLHMRKRCTHVLGDGHCDLQDPENSVNMIAIELPIEHCSMNAHHMTLYGRDAPSADPDAAWSIQAECNDVVVGDSACEMHCTPRTGTIPLHTTIQPVWANRVGGSIHRYESTPLADFADSM